MIEKKMTNYEYWMNRSEAENEIARQCYACGEQNLANFHYNASEGFKKRAMNNEPIPNNDSIGGIHE